MSEHSVSNSMMDLKLQVNRLDDIVDEVDRHIAAGDFDAAALVLGVSTNKVHGFSESYAGLQASLRAAGADPQRSLKRDS
jgi:hypothetical protein